MQAMILAAGRGERMRPLSDTTPKPLLEVGGKPLIVWQLERLVVSGFKELVINVAHCAEAIISALGDGSRLGASIAYSREPQPLEVAGGIATALPFFHDGVVLIVSGDLYTEYDYATLVGRAMKMAATSGPPHAHMVMVPNPAYHPAGDFALAGGTLTLDGAARSTFANIALYRTSLFRELPHGEKLKMLPLYRDWIARGWVSGEIYRGMWANVGTPADLVELDAALRSTSTQRSS